MKVYKSKAAAVAAANKEERAEIAATGTALVRGILQIDSAGKQFEVLTYQEARQAFEAGRGWVLFQRDFGRAANWPQQATKGGRFLRKAHRASA